MVYDKIESEQGVMRYATGATSVGGVPKQATVSGDRPFHDNLMG